MVGYKDNTVQKFSTILYLITGTVLISCGFAFLTIISFDLLDYLLKTHFYLSPSSPLTSLWIRNPVPMHIDFYFFNWTNSDDFQSPYTVKPKFQQIGPYRYKEDKYKVNITWNKNSTVTFQQQRFWHFVPEESTGNDSDLITTVNVLGYIAAHKVRYRSYFIRKSISLALSTISSKFVSKSVRETVFEGYDDPILTLGKLFPQLHDLKKVNDKYAYFFERNGSVDFDGVFNMNTGENNYKDFGKLKYHNYKNRTEYFPNKCGDVYGSAGEIWPIELSQTNVSIFVTECCRPFFFDFEKTVSLFNFNGNKFSAGERVFDNGSLYPSNECFCNGDCVPSGVTNISSCRFGAPLFASFPHFYKADPWYINSIDGMQPNKNLHSFYIVFEPKTSALLDLFARFQLNVLMKPVKDVAMFEDVPTVMVPILWAEQRFQPTIGLIFLLKFILSLPTIQICFNIILIILGVIYICKAMTKLKALQQIQHTPLHKINQLELADRKISIKYKFKESK